jgi:hypothetical protein
MKISRPKIAKLDTGTAARGAYGASRVGTAGQVKSGHHFHAIPAGGGTPNLTGPGGSRPVQKRSGGRNKMY